MNPFVHIIAAVCLTASALAARAGDVQVSVTGTFELAVLGAGPTPISMQFSVPQDVQGAVPAPDSFLVEDLPMLVSFGGTPVTFADTQLAWFSVASFGYFGADFRINGAFAPGDTLQIIVTMPTSPYTGPNDAPRLETSNLDSLYAGLTYYGPAPDRIITQATGFDATYRVAAVPEPATVALLPLGLVWMAWRQRRRASRG